MATTRTFSSMLNEYLTPKLLTSELQKRTWFMDTFEMKTDWKGGDLIVPFEGNPATSISVGELTASNDIAEADFVRGKLTSQPEVWYSLIFNQRDLAEHDGKIPESTFLDVMERVMSSGMDFFKDNLSYQFIGGPEICTVTDDTNAATGVLIVDRIERLQKGQKVVLKDSDSNGSYYITAVNLNTDAIILSATRGGAAADVSAHTGTAPKLYLPGGTTSVFTSAKSALLSAALGGSDTLHTKTKTDYPYLQALQILGDDITATNIVDKLFAAYVTVRRKNRGKANKIVMSLKHWGSVMASQQITKGAYKVVSDPKRSEFGWWETTIASSTNGESLSVVAVPEMNDTEIWFCDPKSARIYSNGGVKKHKTPDGNEYHVVRNTSGYQYIVDICFRGDAAWHAPANNAMLHTISY